MKRLTPAEIPPGFSTWLKPLMCLGEGQHNKQGEQLLFLVVRCYTLPAFSKRSRYTITLMNFTAEVWAVLWKQGEKPRHIYAFQGEAPEDSLKQGEDAAGLQLLILLLPYWEKIYSPTPTEYLETFHLFQIHTTFCSPTWAVPQSVWIASLGSLAWWFLLGSASGVHCRRNLREECKIRVYIFLAPSLWLWPSPRGHSSPQWPSLGSVFCLSLENPLSPGMYKLTY